MNNNQSELKSVSLEEASKIISNLLIDVKKELEETKKNLMEAKAQYEADYVAANDGDSSENAPLDAAIQNLKLVTGEIGNNGKVLQIMESLEDVDYLIGTYDFSEIKDLYHGDFEAMKSQLIKLSTDDIRSIINADDKSSPKLKTAIEKYIAVKELPRYNSCGVVVIYSTVRLRLNSEEYVYKIYPDGVSFIDKGVIAADSRVGKAILGKRKGSKVSIQHASSRQPLVYEILDVY